MSHIPSFRVTTLSPPSPCSPKSKNRLAASRTQSLSSTDSAHIIVPREPVLAHIEFSGWRPERRYRPGRVERDLFLPACPDESTPSLSASVNEPVCNDILPDSATFAERQSDVTNSVKSRADTSKSADSVLKNVSVTQLLTPHLRANNFPAVAVKMARGTRKQEMDFLKLQAMMSDAWVCETDDDPVPADVGSLSSPTSEVVSGLLAQEYEPFTVVGADFEVSTSVLTTDEESIQKNIKTPVTTHETVTRRDEVAAALDADGMGSQALTCNTGSLYKRKLGLQRLVLQGATTAKIPGLGSVIQTSGHQFIPNPGKTLHYAKTGSSNECHSKNSAESRLLMEKQREDKFECVLNYAEINLEQLRQMAWSGVPSRYRARVWQLLAGYVPLTNDEGRRSRTVAQKRAKYAELVMEHFPKRLHAPHNNTFRQIHIDIPRMSLPIFQQQRAQELFERILFIWAIQNPQCGYVQGINDLLTPYFFVYLQAINGDYDRLCPSRNFQIHSALSEEQLKQLEADCYWSLAHLLSSIVDYYTFAQPGIQRNVEFLKDLLQRVDKPLYDHLFKCQVEFLHFSFRWMNNLLIRELPFACVVRLWDTLLTEPEGFSTFIVYVCTSFMCMWSKELQEQPDFQTTLLLLQNLPTSSWGDNEVRLLVADAFRLRYTYEDALSHLKS